MSLKDWLKKWAFVLPLTLAALSAPMAAADDGGAGCAGGSCSGPGCSGPGGWPFHCPKFTHYTPEMPCMKYKHACGKPICDLCDLPGYGYHPTCWRPWDQPLNYNCVVPTPTQLVQPPALIVPHAELLPRR